MNHRRLTAYASFLVISAIWGIAGPVIKYTLEFFPPFIFLQYRFFLATLIALLYFAITRPKWPESRKDQWSVLLISVLTVPVGLGLLFLGFDKTSSLSAGILTALSPITIVLAGWFFLHDRITKTEKIGYVIAALGFFLVVVQPLLGQNTPEPFSLLGNLFIIMHLIAETASATIAKITLRDKVPATALAQMGFVIGFIVLLPVALWLHTPTEIVTAIQQAPLTAHLGVWYMVIFSGAIAYTLKYHAMRSIDLSETAVFGYLLPIWAAPLSIFWLGEQFSSTLLLGAAVTAIGVIVAEWQPRVKKPKKSR